jgi:hypothetical protein
MGNTYSGYPGIEEAPGSRDEPKDDRVKGEVIAQGADASLIRTPNGDTVLTDREGRRRT